MKHYTITFIDNKLFPISLQADEYELANGFYTFYKIKKEVTTVLSFPHTTLVREIIKSINATWVLIIDTSKN